MKQMHSHLTRAVIEVERHGAAAGWDRAPTLFALVRTNELLEREPGLADTLGIDPTTTEPGGLTPVEQEELPGDRELDEVLAGIGWPDEVAGCALVLERLMLPPEVEDELPDEISGETDLAAWVAGHPRRQDVRIAVGVLRDGSRDAAIRLRSHDSDDAVLSGADLVPGLADALADTLEP